MAATFRGVGFAFVAFALGGCASFWDDVTSKDFHVRDWFERPDPIVVLQESNEGDKRAKAYRALGEAEMYPGPERDRVINILSSAACKESQFLCRAAAIEALGNYRDPRVVPGLTKAFYSASTFPGDLAARLQMQALAALGETREPSAEEFLLVVVKDRSKVEGSEQEKQLVLDVRLAAARSLGNFQSDRSEATLTDLIRTERDVAMRDTARLALKHSRGEDSPWDIQAIAGMFLPSTPREKEEAAIVGEPLPSNTQPVQRAGFVQSPQR